jgi:hypothetical protein
MNIYEATEPDDTVEVDEYTGRLRTAFPQQNSIVQNTLNRKLLYTKPEVDAKIAAISLAPAGSGITRSIVSVSINTTAAATALTDYIYLVSGTTTLTLPTAVGNTNRYTVKNVSGSTTIATTGGQTIDGNSTATIGINTSLDLTSDGTNWQIV